MHTSLGIAQPDDPCWSCSVIRCRIFPKKASERSSKFRVDLYKDGQVVGEKVVQSHFERTAETAEQRPHSLVRNGSHAVEKLVCMYVSVTMEYV